MNWQPIETAPTDKEILGFQATPGDNENRMAICWAYVMAPNVVWIGHGGLMPTHWMPLPAPPTTTALTQEQFEDSIKRST